MPLSLTYIELKYEENITPWIKGMIFCQHVSYQCDDEWFSVQKCTVITGGCACSDLLS
jgi:hypothetical protein